MAGRVEEGPAFTEEETALLLSAAPRDRRAPKTLAKIDGLQTSLTHGLLCRNLAALVGRPPAV